MVQCTFTLHITRILTKKMIIYLSVHESYCTTRTYTHTCTLTCKHRENGKDVLMLPVKAMCFYFCVLVLVQVRVLPMV